MQRGRIPFGCPPRRIIKSESFLRVTIGLYEIASRGPRMQTDDSRYGHGPADAHHPLVLPVKKRIGSLSHRENQAWLVAPVIENDGNF